MPQVVAALRRTFGTGKTLPLEFRLEQLRRLKSMLEDNADRWCDALHSDLRRVATLTSHPISLQPKVESRVLELTMTLNEVNGTLKELHSWMKPKKVSRT